MVVVRDDVVCFVVVAVITCVDSPVVAVCDGWAAGALLHPDSKTNPPTNRQPKILLIP
jgi:hypothetical protein